MRRLSAAIAFCLVGGVAAAQEPLDNLAACRLNAEMVALSFSYQGGACEETGDASVEPVNVGTATVTIPIVSTAEVCTMQVVEVKSDNAVAVQEEVSSLDVRLTGTDGQLKAQGTVEIAPNSPECVPPKLD